MAGFGFGNVGFVGSLGGAGGGAAATLPMNLAKLRTMNTASVRVPAFGSVMPGSNYTIEAWVYAAGVQDTSLFSINMGNVNNRVQSHYLLNNGRTYYDSGDVTTGGRLDFPNPAAWSGANVHVALMVDASASQMRWYANGVLYASVNTFTPFTPVAVDLLLGDGAARFMGKMGEFRVWNKVRTPAEIQTDMNLSLNTPRAGLLGCWRMDEAATAVGTQILDRSGNNRHGIVY